MKERSFPNGALILRHCRNADNIGKFDSKWEGAFIANAGECLSSYHLTTPEGETDPHSWNADMLMRYYA